MQNCAELAEGARQARPGARGRGPAAKQAPRSLAGVRPRRGFAGDFYGPVWPCHSRLSGLLDDKLLEDKAVASVFSKFHAGACAGGVDGARFTLPGWTDGQTDGWTAGRLDDIQPGGHLAGGKRPPTRARPSLSSSLSVCSAAPFLTCPPGREFSCSEQSRTCAPSAAHGRLSQLCPSLGSTSWTVTCR